MRAASSSEQRCASTVRRQPSSSRGGSGVAAPRSSSTVRLSRGSELTVLRRELPPPEPGSYYVADLVGLEVFEADAERLGVVLDVLPGVANDALELDSGLLLPLVEECVLDVDLVQRRVVVAPGFADHR